MKDPFILRKFQIWCYALSEKKKFYVLVSFSKKSFTNASLKTSFQTFEFFLLFLKKVFVCIGSLLTTSGKEQFFNSKLKKKSKNIFENFKERSFKTSFVFLSKQKLVLNKKKVLHVHSIIKQEKKFYKCIASNMEFLNSEGTFSSFIKTN